MMNTQNNDPSNIAVTNTPGSDSPNMAATNTQNNDTPNTAMTNTQNNDTMDVQVLNRWLPPRDASVDVVKPWVMGWLDSRKVEDCDLEWCFDYFNWNGADIYRISLEDMRSQLHAWGFSDTAAQQMPTYIKVRRWMIEEEPALRRTEEKWRKTKEILKSLGEMLDREDEIIKRRRADFWRRVEENKRAGEACEKLLAQIYSAASKDIGVYISDLSGLKGEWIS